MGIHRAELVKHNFFVLYFPLHMQKLNTLKKKKRFENMYNIECPNTQYVQTARHHNKIILW